MSVSFGISQNIHVKSSLGYQPFGGIPLSFDQNHNHLKSNKQLMPYFSFGLGFDYRCIISRKFNVFLVGGIQQNLTKFYYSIRAENDWSSYHFENVFFNFHSTDFNLGLHKTISLQENIKLNVGLDYVWKVNYHEEHFAGSRNFPLASYNSYSPFLQSELGETGYYEYRIYLYQRRLNPIFNLNTNLFFKLNENSTLTFGIKIPLLENYVVSQSVDYLIKSSQFVGQYIQFEYGQQNYYKYVMLDFGVLFDLNRRNK